MSESDVANNAEPNESATGPMESVAPRSGLRSDPLDAAPERRRSSIRPVSPDWRPPSRSDRPVRPMVVVYSGDNQGPPIDWESNGSSGPATSRATPAEPFYLPRDLPLPSIPDFEALAPPLQASPAEPAQPEREAVAAFDGVPIAAYAPGEIDALVAYELARAEFRAELETPSVRRELRVAPIPVPLPPPPEAAPEPELVAPRPAWPLVVGGLALGVALAVVSNRATSPRDAQAASSSAVFASAPASGVFTATTSTPHAAQTAALAATALPSAPASSASAAPPELDPDRRSTKVVLTVFPADAKVALRGLKRRGPPYEFDIPRGRRLAIEISRKGYTTRKVVLDGREPELTIGLSPDKRSGRDAAADVAERSIGVRSGL